MDGAARGALDEIVEHRRDDNGIAACGATDLAGIAGDDILQPRHAVDDFDEGLRDIARYERPELNSLIGRVVDGEQIDLGTLGKEEVDYVKTTKILLGQSLYSDSWLEL